MGFNAVMRALAGKGIDCRANEPLSRHTTFRIGGPARLMVFPKNAEELAGVFALCSAGALPWHVVGNGSNLLAADEGVAAVVVSTVALTQVPSARCGELSAAAGESMASLCLRAREEGLTGLEFAYGIPGTLGGAVAMNAGAYGGEMKHIVRRVTAFDPETGRFFALSAAELGFGYRHSVFLERPWVITGAVIGLERGDRAGIQARMDDFLARRKDKQPLELPSAGSAFRRPQGAYAAALIDGCGLKGLRVGGAQVSEKHAGFIVNTGGATCADVLELMRQVRCIVRARTGYLLEPELRRLR